MGNVKVEHLDKFSACFKDRNVKFVPVLKVLHAAKISFSTLLLEKILWRWGFNIITKVELEQRFFCTSWIFFLLVKF